MRLSAAAKAAFKRTEFLSEDQEFRLARLAKSGDQRAMQQLITAYQPLARGMAMRHKSQTPLEDRVQIANTALWHAITKFQPERGRRLSAYAKFWIRRDLNNAGEKAASRLALGNSKKRRAAHQNVLRVCGELGIDPEKYMTDEQAAMVAAEIGVQPHDVRAVVETGDAAFTGCVDHLVDEHDLEESIAISDENNKRLALLEDAISELDEMDADIIRLSVLADKPEPVSSIVKRHGVRMTASEASAHAKANLERIVLGRARDSGLI